MKKLLASLSDWIKIIVLATFFALFFKSCFFDVYTIPSTSMLPSLLPGDVILVNKLRYGPKLLRTPLSLPFMHKYIPFTEGKKSFIETISFPYYRFPGYAEIERNDLLVFQYPVDDLFPVDHRTFYIKRCIGLPSDKIEIVDDVVLVNDSAHNNIKSLSYPFRIKSDQDLQSLFDSLQIEEGGRTSDDGKWEFTLNPEQLEFLKEKLGDESLEAIKIKKTEFDENLFPSHSSSSWNLSFYGPISVPKKGDTLFLNSDNIKMYDRLISVYENHQLSVSPEGEIYIDKLLTNHYIPEMNYYFVMGDNRHNSSDSRYWGFVPEDHIQGRASMVLYSIQHSDQNWGRFNWDRFFKMLR